MVHATEGVLAAEKEDHPLGLSNGGESGGKCKGENVQILIQERLGSKWQAKKYRVKERRRVGGSGIFRTARS